MEMKTIDAKQCTAIALGRLGENEYTVVRFDVSAWLDELPGAVIGLYNQRPGDADAYPIAAIAVEDGVVTWTVTSAELTQTGEGRCELVAIAGDVVAKSAIFRTIIFDALDGSGEVPEPWADWQQQFITLKGEAEQAADRAEEAVEHYPRIVDGVWEVWDGATEQWVSTGVQALGVDGVSPTITVAPITGGHRITITDANGTHTVDVLDGENGDAGRGIVSVQKTGTAGLVDTYTITYTDNTTSTFTVTNGQDGTDGISPSITITDIAGGHRVTITDATGAHSFDVMDGEDGGGAVQDVQVNGQSVVTDGVANVPIATDDVFGAVRTGGDMGLGMYGGRIFIGVALDAKFKSGNGWYNAVTISKQHISTFYGLAKAAGADMKSIASTTVGVYPEAQKSAISTMLNGSVSVSGSTPTINALPGIQYVCGEVATLDITLPASGIVDVVFESGATPTVLTITPPTGVTGIEWADGFDPDNLSANATYWLKAIDGKLGVATAWGVQSGSGGEKPWNHAHFEVTDASEQTTAFIIPNDDAVSEILVRGKALFDNYDGLYFFINDVALLGPNGSLSNTSCYFQIYGKLIAADMWIGRGNVGQWGVTQSLLDVLAKSVSNASTSNGIGDIKIASRWTNKNFQPGTSIDVYWR